MVRWSRASRRNGFVAARRKSEHRGLFDQLAALGSYERFALVGIAGPDRSGGRNTVYVHAKIMLIDDAWATIGSCNLHNASLFANTEMNVSFWEPQIVRALRCELLTEHLDRATCGLDDRAALHLYRRWPQPIDASATWATAPGRGLPPNGPGTYGE